MSKIKKWLVVGIVISVISFASAAFGGVLLKNIYWEIYYLAAGTCAFLYSLKMADYLVLENNTITMTRINHEAKKKK